jgi:ring-1,2-phenylacetyl-CoA epoxidase subunit PaaD
MSALTADRIWQALEEVKDPEIPVVSVVEMGIVRDVALDGERVTVTMTPTFSGCPALDVMRRDIEARVRQMGAADVVVETVLFPPWTTEWMTDAAREKLRVFGLAPPPRQPSGPVPITFYDNAICPRCGSTNTTLRNSFGPTLCRMIWYCEECRDAFEQFKPL